MLSEGHQLDPPNISIVKLKKKTQKKGLFFYQKKKKQKLNITPLQF